jgi:hypothetical protein
VKILRNTLLLAPALVLALWSSAPLAHADEGGTSSQLAQHVAGLRNEAGAVVGSVAFGQSTTGTLGELAAVQRGAPATTYRMCLLADQVPADSCEVLQADGPGVVVLGSLATDRLGRGISLPQFASIGRLRAAFGQGSFIARVELAAITPPSGGCLTARGITFVVPVITIT